MNEDPMPHFQDLLLRRDLTPQEEQTVHQWLADHPAAAASWHEHIRLAHAVRRLPDVPVPSNFTRRVVDEVRRELALAERALDRQTTRPSWLRTRFWLPTASAAAVVLVAAGSWEWHQKRQLAEFQEDVTQLRVIAAVPQQVLEDFDAIQRFAESTPPVDFELLAALE